MAMEIGLPPEEIADQRNAIVAPLASNVVKELNEVIIGYAHFIHENNIHPEQLDLSRLIPDSYRKLNEQARRKKELFKGLATYDPALSNPNTNTYADEESVAAPQAQTRDYCDTTLYDTPYYNANVVRVPTVQLGAKEEAFLQLSSNILRQVRNLTLTLDDRAALMELALIRPELAQDVLNNEELGCGGQSVRELIDKVLAEEAAARAERERSVKAMTPDVMPGLLQEVADEDPCHLSSSSVATAKAIGKQALHLNLEEYMRFMKEGPPKN